MIDTENLSDEDQTNADTLGEELFRILHSQSPEVTARALALLVYEMTATWRRKTIRRQAATGNVISFGGVTVQEVVPTAEGIEELLAAISAEARSIRAFCAEICGEE
jgi:hypothetical protein